MFTDIKGSMKVDTTQILESRFKWFRGGVGTRGTSMSVMVKVDFRYVLRFSFFK